MKFLIRRRNRIQLAPSYPDTPMRRAFTLIELLVVIAVIALLVGLLLPALAAARVSSRATACASHLQQLGIALNLYFNDYDNTLPQATTNIGGNDVIIGTLYGGKKGSLPAYDINNKGAELRPLNRYILDVAPPPDSDTSVVFEMEAFKSPCDKGGTIPNIGPVNSVYDLLGSSYAINDHANKPTQGTPEVATLVPNGGGKMPYIVTPSKTWLLGSQTIFNADGGDNNQYYWYTTKNSGASASIDMKANLLFADWHVGIQLSVPAGPVNTTKDYTFWPIPPVNASSIAPTLP